MNECKEIVEKKTRKLARTVLTPTQFCGHCGGFGETMDPDKITKEVIIVPCESCRATGERLP